MQFHNFYHEINVFYSIWYFSLGFSGLKTSKLICCGAFFDRSFVLSICCSNLTVISAFLFSYAFINEHSLHPHYSKRAANLKDPPQYLNIPSIIFSLTYSIKNRFLFHSSVAIILVWLKLIVFDCFPWY